MREAALLRSDERTQLFIHVLHAYQRRRRSVCGLSPPTQKQDRDELEQTEIPPDLSEGVEFLSASPRLVGLTRGSPVDASVFLQAVGRYQKVPFSAFSPCPSNFRKSSPALCCRPLSRDSSALACALQYGSH